MAKEFARQFYNSRLWKRTRKTYITIRQSVDGGLCEECQSALGYIVHHRQELTEKNITDMGIAIDFNNLELVCKECHDKFDGHGVNNKAKPSGYLWTEDGQPIPIEPRTKLEDITSCERKTPSYLS